MARRRSTSDDSSLELLLDTVTNAFGGIVFITILVCVMPSRVASVPAPTEAQTDVRRLVLEKLRFEVAEKEAIIQALEETFRRLENPELEAQLKILAELEERERQLRQSLEIRKEEDHELDAEIAEARKELEDLESLRNRLQKALVKAEREAMDLTEVRSTRLPRLRQLDKSVYFLALSRGKVYLVWRPGVRSLEVDYNAHDFVTTQMGQGVEFRPRAEGGEPASTWLQSPSGAARLFLQLSADRHVVHFIVYSDSLVVFNEVRNAFTTRGYDYNWSANVSGEGFTLVPRTRWAEAQ